MTLLVEDIVKETIEKFNKLATIKSKPLDTAALTEKIKTIFRDAFQQIENKRWSRYLVIDFSHPWLKSTRQRAKLLAATVLRPSRFALNEQTFASHNDSTAA